MLSRAEQWPHRREDWRMLLDLSSGVVALNGDDVIGTTLRTDYGPDVSAVNMIIVAEPARGRGVGRRLMQAVMEEDDDREYRLVATREGLPLYRKLGFEPSGEITQCQGILQSLGQPGTHIAAAGCADIDDVIALDRRYFAADRIRLLDWLVRHGNLALTRSADGGVTAYAAARRFGHGHVIGPILAPDQDQAKDLIRYFAQTLAGSFVRIDTDNALGLASWLETIGLVRAGGGITMRKNAKTEPLAAFGLCSQALG